MPFVPIPEILEELKAGRPIVLVDDEDRENEGDVVYAAEKCDAAAINFMVKYSRGLVCLALTNDQCDKLRLHPQTHINTAQLGTAFTVTVDAHPRFGVTTGVSAKDRAKTEVVRNGPAIAKPGVWSTEIGHVLNINPQGRNHLIWSLEVQPERVLTS